MIEPKRLREETEIYDAIQRHKAQQHSDKIWAAGLLILALHALTHYWLFVRPKRLARLTLSQIQFRRRFWLIVATVTVITVYIAGLFS